MPPTALRLPIVTWSSARGHSCCADSVCV